MQPGDTIMGLSLAHGGHLTHGMKINVSGRLYDIAAYEVDRETSLIDMDDVARHRRGAPPEAAARGLVGLPAPARLRRASARSPTRSARSSSSTWRTSPAWSPPALHPNPVPYADVVTTTTHKTLGGPRGGLILCSEEYAKKIDSAVFPGQQGGPLEHVIAAKAVALRSRRREAFRERQQRTIAGAQAVAEPSCWAPATASTS